MTGHFCRRTNKKWLKGIKKSPWHGKNNKEFLFGKKVSEPGVVDYNVVRYVDKEI